MSSLRYLSVCSGMEAASVAWEPLGFTPVGFSEIEAFPCAILSTRYPNTPNYGSLTEYKQWPIKPGAIDLLVGGTPCQSFSVAGLRKGLDDPRGNLALVFLGLADKLKPRWIVWENVPGVLSSNGGRDLGSFLGALVQLGYGFAMRVLDAQHFGVPQRRRRVFVVACLGDWRAPAEVLLESDCVRRDIKKGRAKGQGVAAGSEGGVDANHPEGCWWDGGQVSQTLDAVLQKGQTMPEKNRFPAVLTPCPDHDTVGTLCARDFKGVGNQYVQEGKCIPCSEQPLTYDMKQHHNPQPSDNVQLTTKNCAFVRGDTPLVQPIPFRKSKRACSTTDNETWVEADASNTLNNFDLGDTRTTHAVVEPVIPIHDQATRFSGKHGDKQDGKGNGLGIGQPGDPMNTLTQGDKHAIAYHTMPGSVAPTVTSSGPPYSRTGNERVEAEALAVTVNIYGGNKRKDRPEGGLYVRSEDTCKCLDAANGLNPTCSQGGTAVVGSMAVRRLTPIECERLQGFPDNWSRISWKGKPEDQCPDGPRYKACGNSMAVPVMRWIGERILTVNSKL